MPRTIIKCPGVPEIKASAEGTQGNGPLKNEYSIQVVTALFGGGVVAGVNDPVTVIRGPSIRGQLRFWWRATRGAGIENVKDLKDKENEIWGSTMEPGKVSLSVEIKPCKRLPYGKFDGKKFLTDFPEYACFPFVDMKHKTVKDATSGIEFHLSVTMSSCSYQKDVEAALWAWINFGGIGARTRRGCGSLYCRDFAPQNKDGIKSWYEGQLRKYEIVPSTTARKWPTIPQAADVIVKPSTSKPLQAWREAINLIRTFRQGINVGRNPGEANNRPGRSLWPEPDSIRDMTGIACDKHKIGITCAPNAFPRAEFGMPIIFQFKDLGDPVNIDKKPPQLLPENGERMGSPLIIKPLCVSPESACPLIMRLKTESLQKARLKHDNDHHINASEIRNPRFSTYNKSPLAGLSSAGSALEAFMNYAVKEGYR